jgi:hypothetical protein
VGRARVFVGDVDMRQGILLPRLEGYLVRFEGCPMAWIEPQVMRDPLDIVPPELVFHRSLAGHMLAFAVPNDPYLAGGCGRGQTALHPAQERFHMAAPALPLCFAHLPCEGQGPSALGPTEVRMLGPLPSVVRSSIKIIRALPRRVRMAVAVL